jgi:hypothetical protein
LLTVQKISASASSVNGPQVVSSSTVAVNAGRIDVHLPPVGCGDAYVIVARG